MFHQIINGHVVVEGEYKGKSVLTLNNEAQINFLKLTMGDSKVAVVLETLPALINYALGRGLVTIQKLAELGVIVESGQQAIRVIKKAS